MDSEKMVSLNPDDLELVSGGKKNQKVDVAEKYDALRRAWKGLKFPEHGYTSHTLDAYADEWEAAGFKPKAKTFLMRFVTWDV